MAWIRFHVVGQWAAHSRCILLLRVEFLFFDV